MAGIILIGGKSTRMGVDKATLIYQGKTLLEHVASAMREATSEPIIAVGGDENQIMPDGVARIDDDFPDCGPMGGLITGLRIAGKGIHLCAACDMPFLFSTLLAALKDKLSEEKDSLASIPELNRMLEPLCAAYRFEILPKLETATSQGIRSLQKTLRTMPILTIQEDELRTYDPNLTSFENWNHPGDIRSG